MLLKIFTINYIIEERFCEINNFLEDYKETGVKVIYMFMCGMYIYTPESKNIDDCQVNLMNVNLV